MTPNDTKELTTRIDAWIASPEVFIIQVTLGELDEWIPLLEDKRSAGSNGIWRYYLTADGLWGTYEPTCLAMNHGAKRASCKVESKQLAHAVFNCGQQYCCWKSFMYDLEHNDNIPWEKREYLTPQEPA